ncbi:hypothetical protein ACI8AF_00515 [Blastococcus sp. SYSU D00669]
MWPTVAVLGFLLLTGVVVALGAASTARYEFERNRVPRKQAQPAEAASRSAHPAGTRAARPAGAEGAVAVAPAPVSAPVAPAAASRTGWWLVDENDSDVVAGPFPDRMDADWAALASGLAAGAVHGTLREDGRLARKPSPEERAWLAELGDHLDGLPEDWDELLTDTDPLTTLVVEVAAALVEAGVPLHDCAQRGERPTAAGGACLVPDLDLRGVLVSWRPHDRMSIDRSRGAAADDAVQRIMNGALAGLLLQLGFVVEPFGDSGCSMVLALR